MKTISLSELQEWQKDERCFALLDVLPDYEGQEVEKAEKRRREFVEKIARLSVRKEHPIVLYEASTAKIEAAAAAEALNSEGFEEVYCFLGPQAALYETQHDQGGER